MRFAVLVEYEGTAFHGWQYQSPSLPTIQAAIEKAISVVADETIRVVSAGRTDAGVHALGQVIHFDTQAKRTEYSWLMGINANLPHDISVLAIEPVSSDFSARFSAYARRYYYLIGNQSIRPAILRRHITWIPCPLDIEAMQQATEYIVGQQDFSAFRAKDCQAKSPIKTIEHCCLLQQDNLLLLDIKANAFLHHMVRNIVGSLLLVGKGDHPPIWIQQVINSLERKQAGPTAAPTGLHLAKIYYPELLFAGKKFQDRHNMLLKPFKELL